MQFQNSDFTQPAGQQEIDLALMEPVISLGGNPPVEGLSADEAKHIKFNASVAITVLKAEEVGQSHPISNIYPISSAFAFDKKLSTSAVTLKTIESKNLNQKPRGTVSVTHICFKFEHIVLSQPTY